MNIESTGGSKETPNIDFEALKAITFPAPLPEGEQPSRDWVVDYMHANSQLPPSLQRVGEDVFREQFGEKK